MTEMKVTNDLNDKGRMGRMELTKNQELLANELYDMGIDFVTEFFTGDYVRRVSKISYKINDDDTELSLLQTFLKLKNKFTDEPLDKIGYDYSQLENPATDAGTLTTNQGGSL